MYRTCSLAAVFVLVTCWMTAFADPPPINDPEAKVAVVIDSVTVDPTDKSTIKVKLRTSAATDWAAGPPAVKVILQDPANGAPIFVPAALMQDAEKTYEWTATVPSVANGTYQVWAIIDVTKGGDKQQVGSEVKRDVTVNNNPSAPSPGQHVRLKFTKGPTRSGGGLTISGEGNGIILNPDTWELVGSPGTGKPVEMVCIPTGGGAVRLVGVDPTVTGGLLDWSASRDVSGTQDYNVMATVGARTKDKKTAQVVGTGWKQVPK